MTSTFNNFSVQRNSKTFLICLLLAITQLVSAQDTLQLGDSSSDVRFRAIAEVGFLAVLSHKVQFGRDGTYFDYVDQGGQNVLFPTTRFSLELDFNKYNTFILLYQPLRLETQALLLDDLVANGTTFPSGTAVNFLYNFPFYRISYLRELTRDNEKFNFAIGASLQIRNATISFESTDGTLFTDNRDIGPVPALKIRTKWNMSEKFYSELEADGIYAPISYINGSDNDVTGAILDASIRFGAHVNKRTNIFLNFRILGGGATGQSDDEPGPGDGYVANWLNFMNVSTGFVLYL